MIPVYEKDQTIGDKRLPRTSFFEHYLVDTSNPRPFVIVVPGGGYNHLAAHEGKDIAEWLNARNIHAGVFYYQLETVNLELLLNQVNEIVAEYKSNPQFSQIGIIGFSAGGHLAAMCSTKNPHKPDFSILSYPVITMEEPFAHVGSRTQLSPDSVEKAVNEYSAEKWVSVETPKTFLWHTAEDQAVPVENALLYANELSAHKVPYELHIFQTGRHGLGLATDEAYTKEWPTLLEQWLEKNGVTK